MANPNGNPTGRNRVALTKENIDKLYQELSRGVPISYACIIAGISKSSSPCQISTFYYFKCE